MATQDTQNYALIIIGSGIGALTLASIMAQLQQQKVLLLEQHYVAGGFTHVFRRPGKYKWDVGLHYVGEMAEGTPPRAVFDYISQGQLKWHKMNEPFEKFVYPDFTFDLHGDKRRFEADLIQRFPTEEEAIKQYFTDLKLTSQWLKFRIAEQILPELVAKMMQPFQARLKKLALMTTGEYLDLNFHHSQLKALLVSQWGDYGLPPQKSAFVAHAMVVGHYLKGGYYPVGGSEEIAKAILPVIREAGGECLVNRKVQKVLIANDEAIGVEVIHKKGNREVIEHFYAPKIVSNAGAFNTYFKLLPPEYCPEDIQDLRHVGVSASAVSVYIGFKDNPEALGFKGENHWVYSSYDHQQHFSNANLIEGTPAFCYLSFPSLKDPEAKLHTAEIITVCNYELFESWSSQPWKKRDEEYQGLKERIAEGMLSFIEERYPGFRDLIDYYEVSTPVTVEHFTDSPKGSIYGMTATPERFKQKYMSVHTPIKNLYLTGADALSFGIVGAMMGGVLTAGVLRGAKGLPEMLKTLFKEVGKK